MKADLDAMGLRRESNNLMDSAGEKRLRASFAFSA